MYKSRRTPITVSQGDRIHHPHHGIGEIQSIRRRSFSGKNGSRFAEIFFKRERITLIVSEDSLDGTVRPPIGPSRARKLLEHMKTWNGSVSNQWKTRANKHQEMMEAGAPRAYAEVYKNLRVREQDDALSAADRKHLQRCSEFLSEELGNALNKPRAEALEQMAKVTQI